MGFSSLMRVFALSQLVCLSCFVFAQQPYVRKSTTNCTDKSNSVLGYTCNGLNSSCQAYLIFRAQFPYDNVSSISDLLASDPSELSQINAVSEEATFGRDKEVIVPVNCACSGEYYQTNTSYVLRNQSTVFLTANNTFQGLSTCQAILDQNPIPSNAIHDGTELTVPLRCACPTKNQTDLGVKFLLSYLVTSGNDVSTISERFGADTSTTLEANQLSLQDSTIYPFTTLLVPLKTTPSNSQTITPSPSPPPPPPPPPPSSPSSASPSFAVIGSLAGIVILAIGVGIFCIYFRKKSAKANSFNEPLQRKIDEESAEFSEIMYRIAETLKVYSFKELQSATDDFSPAYLIQGSVYRGEIRGDPAAIKKMNGDVSKEINLLNKINHFNLICLSGVCFSDGHWYLVYEYASNGALSDWIHSEPVNKKLLNWRQRMQIALDVATGLSYLHSYTTPPHVHKDITSSNVLLDSDFRAKITNLGLAVSAKGEEEGEFALTRHIVGTIGYMAPEYLEDGLVSTKLDVYAFGILLLEIITGKDVQSSGVLPVEFSEDESTENLKSLLDPSLQEHYAMELIKVVVRLIYCCLKKNPAARPGMDEIVSELSIVLSAALTGEL